MPSTDFVDHPRAPRTTSCDGALVRPMAAQAWRATFPTANIAVRYAVTVVLGALVWWSTHSLVLGLLVGVVTPTVALVVTRVRIELNIREVAGRGRAITTGYDDRGRLVVERTSGVVAFARGDARRVERVGEVLVVRPLRRGPAFVTPHEVLDDADLDFLTAGPDGRDRARDFAVDHPGITCPVVVTRDVQRALYRVSVRALVLHPLSAVVAAVALAALVLLALHPTPVSGMVLAATLVFVVVVYLAGPRLAAVKQFPVGSVMGAEVGADGLAVELPDSSATVQPHELRAVTVSGDGIAVRTRAQRTYVLPRTALTEADLDQLRALIGR